MASTGQNFRQRLLAIRSYDLPLTGKLEIRDDHTVSKPVIIMEVHDGEWVRKASAN
jgi:branched-chain amino acid transport system substrate-binding protein